MKCEVCNETELEGELAVLGTSAFSQSLDEEIALISLRETTRRNHIICGSCNKAVCHNCCTHPKSGFCDRCIEKYKLHNLVREIEEGV
jgi:hypothetical protein